MDEDHWCNNVILSLGVYSVGAPPRGCPSVEVVLWLRVIQVCEYEFMGSLCVLIVLRISLMISEQVLLERSTLFILSIFPQIATLLHSTASN